ncbi:sel1 repeat family protein [Mangrovibrevibacter kandeliae]|uniref:sel1 repeat family protein n=1 Tax=Mangrovibrevibacter kandeliae TaxID=2968473 RepID=UPI002119745C|nr:MULTISPECIES: sel1 repeat family protein [unclassified Aurantimonas]MCQ8781117.1 sel1 repeat family protein [Aurantimonas sp. CSK15Z-1]MCW4113897.1 sel1 repeat family protein [Aurantimonas sp. MSK8Z-1]
MARFELLDPSMAAAGGVVAPGADILFELGMRCASGRDGAVDLVAAHMYFNLADQKGAERASFYRQEVAEQMSKTEIGKALRAARQWLTLH